MNSHIFKWNIGLMISFGLTWCLAKLGFPEGQWLVGSLVFILPGLNLAWLLEQLSGVKLQLANFIGWSVIAAPIAVAVITYLTASIVGRIDDKIIIGSFAGLITTTAALALLARHWLRQPTTKLAWTADSKLTLTCWYIIISFLVLQLGHFLLYRYIPEGDGYTALIDLRLTIQSGHLPETGRILFQIFNYCLSVITHIDPYWLFKAWLPLVTGLIMLPYYKLARRHLAYRSLIVLATLSPFLFPVISLESLMSRPQLAFLIALPIYLWLLESLRAIKSARAIYWHASLLLLATFAIKFHEFFLILVLLTGFGLINSIWLWIKRYPLESLFIGAMLIIGIYPWMQRLGLVATIQYLVNPLLGRPLHFQLWFIGHYINVDGVEVGWPGWSWLFYYGYNLGLALPILLSGVVWQRQIGWRVVQFGQFPLLAGIFFFTLAEVMPRFNLAYLPDRAWILLSLCLAFAVPGLIKHLSRHWSNRFATVFTVILISLSWLTNWTVTFLKQGAVSSKELSAAHFISNETPSASIIISQAGNSQLISYYARRRFLNYDVFNSTMTADKIVGVSRSAPELLSETDPLNRLRIKHLAALSLSINGLQSTSSSNFIQNFSLIQQAEIALDGLKKIERQFNVIQKQGLATAGPVYILYSTDKFTSIYSQRDWWRTANYADADLAKFDHMPFELVFDNNSVKIWRVNETAQ